MEFTTEKISNIIAAKSAMIARSTAIDHISIDSRSLENGPSTLFFAIDGPNKKGVEFIPELYDQGARNFVVSKIPITLADANFLVVENTLAAFQKFAAFYRSQFDFPIIAITGSNGKTIVKEWLNFLLSPDFSIVRSPKSYNSQVGVPLSVLSINEHHDLGVFEAGISRTNEMQNLLEIIKPTIGILTNIGSAHDEGFENAGEKIKEKAKLFAGTDVAILQKNRTIEAFLSKSLKLFTWSLKKNEADVSLSTRPSGIGTQIHVEYLEDRFEVQIPFHDNASVENAITCLTTMLYLEYSPEIISKRMALLYPVEMRLKVKNGINRTTLIDDSYSNDFQSLKIALDFLESQKQHKRKTLIISDIFQSGLTDEALYAKVSQLLISNKIHRIIGIGETISKFKGKFANITVFETTSDFLDNLNAPDYTDQTILIKGARSFRFEQIVATLEQKTHETVFEINLNALGHNLNYYRSKLEKSTKIMVMVKAFGYGAGGYEVAKLLEHQKVDYLGVAFADEGIDLKSAGISTPIMVLNPENSSFSAIIDNNLEPEIYSFTGLDAFLKVAAAKKVANYPIHIKVDTGMHRLGFNLADAAEIGKKLLQHKTVKIQSVLSHLAASDEPQHREFTLEQISKFKKFTEELSNCTGERFIRHLLNTGGVAYFPEAQFEMVRLGIGLYGVSDNEMDQKMLQTVGTIKSIISQIRNVPAGESVGYSRNYIAEKDAIIATIPIGYADGIPRSWASNGYVMINGKKAPITGKICMDMLMADVTEIQCKDGDTVIIIGEKPSPKEIADAIDTIPYEIMTGISQRVKRLFYRE